MELQNRITLSLALSQEMQLSLKILQMNALELYDYYAEVLVENAAADLSVLDRRPEFVDTAMSPNHSNYQSLSDLLKDQIPPLLPETDRTALLFLIAHLNRRGFLPVSIEKLREGTRFTLEQLRSAQKHLQAMEPAGIGAGSTQECLLLQLDRQPEDSTLEREIILHHMPELAAGNLRRIASLMNKPYPAVQKAAKRIRLLNPIPTNGFQDSKKPQYIVPELRISLENDQLVLYPNPLNTRTVEITPGFSELLNQTEDPAVKSYMKEQLAALRTIQYCVKQRNLTLTRITEEILQRQLAFFLGKSNHLQPLSLEDISKAVGVAPSTVSRAIQGKYLVCVHGVFPYKHFFSRKLPSSQSNDPQSTSLLMSLIQKYISQEDPQAPLSDQQLCGLLQSHGIYVARRTVTKYREKLGIPATYLRREFQANEIRI